MKTKIVALLVFATVLYTASVSQATSEIRFREAEDAVLTTPGPPLINLGRPVPSLLLSSAPLTRPADFPDDQPPGTDDDGTGTTLASGGLYYWTDDDQSGGNS
ncbi:MAG: hypothetical protein IID32_06695, partial [Planctomycetes bacterium]|nr:hypothetical protein [Planctomycetota bacterium]